MTHTFAVAFSSAHKASRDETFCSVSTLARFPVCKTFVDGQNALDFEDISSRTDNSLAFQHRRDHFSVKGLPSIATLPCTVLTLSALRSKGPPWMIQSFITPQQPFDVSE